MTGLIWAIVAVSLVLLSVIVVHLQYFIENRNVLLKKINENEFRYYKNGVEFIITNDNILTVEKFTSYNYNTKAAKGLLPTDDYHYYIVTLKDRDKLIITSLLIDDFSFFINKTKVHKRFIAWLNKKS